MVGLVGVRRAAVLAVVAQLMRQAQVANCVSVYNARSAPRHETPHTPLRVQNRQLEGGARALVHVTHGAFMHRHRLPERHWKLELSPFLRVFKRRGVIQLATHVQRDGIPDGVHGKRVELHVRKVELLKNNKHSADKGVHALAQLRRDTRSEVTYIDRVNVFESTHCHLLDMFPVVLDFHAARLAEQESVAEAGRLDGKIKFFFVRHKGLDDEGIHLTEAAIHLDFLPKPPLDKHFYLFVVQVQAHEVVLATLPEQHVRLNHQLCRLHPGVGLEKFDIVGVETHLRGVRRKFNAAKLLQMLLQKRLRGVLPYLLARHTVLIISALVRQTGNIG
mmetsp:Transcript_13514/g.23985  ORF Transcript_13514/g.23985 Transcript_13514/m.23985 type:complete len:333 (+) Transcript_13514:886-1884(+)